MGESVALVGGRVVVGYGAGVIGLDAEAVFVHVAELVLRGRKSLVGGLAVPDEGLRVVLRDTATAKIEIGESELGLGVTCGGLDAERREIVGLRRGRSGLLGIDVT